jgi:DNA polymerase-3 subunit gamma/tau
MRQALYRKYRSKSLDQIIGQEHITDTLRHAIAKQRISHAYLFTGPRGVGKTSIARILAHQLNDVPYTGEDSHLDIIEIDAASTGGVDEIRELREKVYIAPANGKYKVYIIDEVHMMSTAAFNALLKTLEEPPAHVIFILATTEAHKLPATIISRTQRYSFRPITTDKIINHLRYIASQENIDITDDALNLIADHSEGSFRDSIGMLDQASSLHKKINRDDLEQLLGIPPDSAINELISALSAGNSLNLVNLLTLLRSNGFQATTVAKQLNQKLRILLLNNQDQFNKRSLINLLTRLIEVSASHNPDQFLELILLDYSLSDSENNESSSTQQLPNKTDNKEDKSNQSTTEKSKIHPKDDSIASVNDTIKTVDLNGSQTIDKQMWQSALSSLKERSNTLYGVIKQGEPEFQPGKIILTFGHIFHQKQATIAKNKLLLTNVLSKLTGDDIEIVCIYRKEEPKEISADENINQAPDNFESLISPLETINNIFGSSELIES